MGELIGIERRGQQLLLQAHGARMLVFDPSAGRRGATPLAEFGRPGAQVSRLVAQADADTVVVCYEGQGRVECWNWRAAQAMWARALDGEITQLVELGSGSIAAGAKSGDVCVWSAAGEEVLKRKLDDEITQLVELGSGSIAAGTSSGDVCVWSAAGEEVLKRKLDDEITQLVELGSGSIAAGAKSGDVCVWSAAGEE
eukprot:COSAG06_NODE_16317_length_1007_cov_2.609031_1_plen_197_part_10